MFYEKNTSALAKSPINQPVLELLEKVEAATEVEIYETHQMEYTIFYKGVYLHDQKYPADEIQEVCDNNCVPGVRSTHVVMGIGMGYLLQEVFKRSTGRIYVYEPDLPLLRFILENIDLTEFFGSDRVFLVGSQEDLIRGLHSWFVPGQQFDVLTLKSYAYLMAAEIPDLMEQLLTLARQKQMTFNTFDYYHYQWIQQFFMNLPHFTNVGTLNELFDRFTGKPAIVISSGPSLDDAMEDIRRIGDKAVVVAIGSALKRLYEENIVPDYVVFLDRLCMDAQLEGVPDEFIAQTTFLMSPFTQECCFVAPAKSHRLLLGANNPSFPKWLDKIFDMESKLIPGGATVSIMALQVAQAMGCNPITIVGQDLAFRDKQVYAGGASAQVNEERGLVQIPGYHRLLRLEYVKGQNGDMMYTTSEYSLFVRHLRDIAHENNKRPGSPRLINASVGGAYIDGFEHMSMTDMIAQVEFPEWDKPSEMESLIVSYDVEQRAEQLRHGLVVLKQEIQQTMGRLISLTRRVDKALEKRPDQWHVQLENLQRERDEFEAYLTFYPFVKSFMDKENLSYLCGLLPEPKGPEDIKHNLHVMDRYYNNCRKLLKEIITPWTELSKEKVNLVQEQAPEKLRA